MNPTYQLQDIKNALNRVSKLRMTRVARQGANELGMDDQDIINAIQAITPSQFYKTMPSNKLPNALYLDVYRTHWNGKNVYAKFQDVCGFLVVSFKLR